MQNHRMLLGAAALGLVGFIVYNHHKGHIKFPLGSPTLADGSRQVDLSAASGFFKGYTQMMKIPPEYYNNSTLESTAGPEFMGDWSESTLSVPTPWTLPAVQGNGMQIMGGWTNWGDQFSNRDSEWTLTEKATAAHL